MRKIQGLPVFRVVVVSLNWKMLAGPLIVASGKSGQRRVRQMILKLIVCLLAVAAAALPTGSVLAGHGDPHTLTVSTTGTGGGTVTSTPPGITCPGECTEDYDDGTGVTLSA